MTEPVAPLAGAGDLASYLAGDPDTLMAAATGAIRSYCGWHIAPAVTEELVLDGKGSAVLQLPTLHVTEVTSVTDQGYPLDLDTQVDWSAAGYLELRTGGVWSRRPRQVVVNLTHGWETVPDELVEVATSIAARAKSSPMSVLNESAGGVSRGFSQVAPGVAGGVALLAHEKAILDRYKLP